MSGTLHRRVPAWPRQGAVVEGARRLRESTRSLLTAAEEDRPDVTGPRATHKVVTDLVQTVQDLDDAAHRVAASAGTGRAGPASVVLVHRELVEVDRILRRGVAGPDGPVALASEVSSRWGPPWRAWTGVLLAGVRDVEEALTTIEDQVIESLALLLPQHTTMSEEGSR